jgi:branched-chain amino acid transport system substrate-binding protein
MFSAQGYDAVYLLAKAMKEAKVTDCTDRKQRKAMRDKLAAIKGFKGVSGELSFDKEGNATKKPAIQKVVKTKDGYKFQLIN